jgi:hypothetical protein
VRKLVSKKELKSLLGIPYCFAQIARLEAAGQFPRSVPDDTPSLPLFPSTSA